MRSRIQASVVPLSQSRSGRSSTSMRPLVTRRPARVSELMCGGDDLADAFRCHLAVVHRDGKTLVLDAHSRNLGQGSAQFGGGALEDRYENRGRVVAVMRAVRPRQLEAVAARVPEAGYADPAADIREVTTAQDGHRAHLGDEFQRLGGTVDEPGRTGIRDDGGQRSVVVQEQHRLACAGDADQLTVGLHAHSGAPRSACHPCERRRRPGRRARRRHRCEANVVGAPVPSMPMTSANPPSRAAATPAAEFSTTTHRCGRTPSRRVASRSTAGSGFSGVPRSPAIPSMQTPNRSSIPANLQRLPALRARRIGRRGDADALATSGPGRPSPRRAARRRSAHHRGRRAPRRGNAGRW